MKLARTSLSTVPVRDRPSGVTYRGYLGATGDTSAMWISEEQLKETQALLRMAAAAGRLGAWSVDLARRAWVWSDEVKAIHEVEPDYQPQTREALAFYEPESRAQLVVAFEACSQRGVPFDLQLQLVTAQGNEVWIRVIGEADRHADGRITHVRGALQDITSFRRAADEARRVAERFTRTMEGLKDGLIVLDHELRFVFVNGGAERMLRRSRHSLLGLSLMTAFPETASGKFLEHCIHTLRRGESREFGKFYPPLGLWLHITLVPSDVGLTLCLHDDTERINARREILALRAQVQALRARTVT